MSLSWGKSASGDVWTLAKADDEEIAKARAFVKLDEAGQWSWKVVGEVGSDEGLAADRDSAIAAAEAAIADQEEIAKGASWGVFPGDVGRWVLSINGLVGFEIYGRTFLAPQEFIDAVRRHAHFGGNKGERDG